MLNNLYLQGLRLVKTVWDGWCTLREADTLCHLYLATEKLYITVLRLEDIVWML